MAPAHLLMTASRVRQSCAINATSSRSDTATSRIRESSGRLGVVSVHPMSRESALQIRPLTPRGTHRSEIDVEDAHGARGGNAKTDMADSLLIAVTNVTNLLNCAVFARRRMIGGNNR